MIVPEEARLGSGIYYRHWRPDPPVRAVVLLVHGMGEHSGRYQGLADYLGERQIAVIAPDHLGHGESPGRRAHVSTFEDFMLPVAKLRDAIDDWYPGLPCFLVGHSMGGLIAARLLLEHQHRYRGAVLSGPALKVEPPPPRLQRLLIATLSRLWPGLGVLQLDADQVSRDPEVVARYRADPLVHDGKISARLVQQLFHSIDMVAQRRGDITLPLLVLHGDADSLTAPSGSEEFCAGVDSDDLQLKLYPGLYHEIFNEPERLQVLADLEQWLGARL